MPNNNHVVIMAGGVGSRFWPMSTPDCPKQFIDVLGCGKTLIQLTAARFKEVCLPENMWVVTSAGFAGLVKEQLPDLPFGHILLEPCMRNTAPCIAYASWKIKSIDPNANIVVTPSDHIVTDVTEFRRIINMSLAFVDRSDAILTLGMKPTRPETGYGYIEADLNATSNISREIYRVDSFKEKPDLETAAKYLGKENFFWNSGIFIWNIKTIIHAIRIYEPTIAQIFESLIPYYDTDFEQEMINRKFPDCPNISIDYAILERAEEIFVLPADFGWSDLGTWGSLHEQLSKDNTHNAVLGKEIKLYETKNCVISVSDTTKVVIQGLDGYIVAEKEGRLLICRLSEEQRIKEFSQ